MPIRLLIADDNPGFLDSLRQVFESTSDICVTAVASSGKQAVELARLHHPDIALLDVRMPDLNGIEAAREIARMSPPTAVVLLSIQVERSYVLESVKAGAVGYLSKLASLSEFIEAVRNVARGGASFVPAKPSQR